MFTSLYVKTNYSLLSSLVSIDNLILYAVEHKLSALAICDDNMTSTKIFYDKCIKNNIKPIIGLDLKYNNSNILMYAKSFTGYQSLIKLSTISSERDITITDLETYNNDVVVVLPYKDFALYNHTLYFLIMLHKIINLLHFQINELSHFHYLKVI